MRKGSRKLTKNRERVDAAPRRRGRNVGKSESEEGGGGGVGGGGERGVGKSVTDLIV